jgi:hypothetical protein
MLARLCILTYLCTNKKAKKIKFFITFKISHIMSKQPKTAAEIRAAISAKTAEIVELKKQALALEFSEKYGFSIEEPFTYPREGNPNRQYRGAFKVSEAGDVKLYRVRIRQEGSVTVTEAPIKMEYDHFEKVG